MCSRPVTRKFHAKINGNLGPNTLKDAYAHRASEGKTWVMIWYPQPFSTAIWKNKKRTRTKIFVLQLYQDSALPFLSLHQVHPTFGNMLTGYLKAVNCSENFTYWVMGHVCLIKINDYACTILGNLIPSYEVWFWNRRTQLVQYGNSINQACYDK